MKINNNICLYNIIIKNNINNNIYLYLLILYNNKIEN